ncbi:MAG: hypothetical protein JWN78_830 [Bacteroidota bacterium]|nr:hypothetical protein [Bacteroidota bacterium]
MTESKTCNIGLSVGTRIIGFAVLCAGTLLEYKVLTFKERWSKTKLVLIVSSLKTLLSRYNIAHIGIKTPAPSYCTQTLLQVIKGLQQELTRMERPFCMYTVDDLKGYCLPDMKGNKKSLSEYVGNKYPELFMRHKRESKSKNAHYIKLFEATIAAELSKTENAQ